MFSACVSSSSFAFHFDFIIIIITSTIFVAMFFGGSGNADSLSFIYSVAALLLGIISLEPSVHAPHSPVRYYIAIVGVCVCKVYASPKATVRRCVSAKTRKVISVELIITWILKRQQSEKGNR